MSFLNESTMILSLDAYFKPVHVCAVKPEVLKSWTLEIDFSRAPCLGADQKTRGLWERDCLLCNLMPCAESAYGCSIINLILK